MGPGVQGTEEDHGAVGDLGPGKGVFPQQAVHTLLQYVVGIYDHRSDGEVVHHSLYPRDPAYRGINLPQVLLGRTGAAQGYDALAHSIINSAETELRFLLDRE